MSSDRDPLINREIPGENEGFFDRIFRPCAAEFIGVMLFVFVGTLSVFGAGNILGVALTHGLTISLLVVGTGSISGAHLNPAVTLAICLCGGIGPVKAILYFVSQITGGIIGASLTRGVLNESNYTSINGGAHALGPNTSVGEGFLIEVLLTSLLVTVILLAAVDEGSKSALAPLGIGFAVIVDILAGGSLTGASMNPARSFGPAVAVSTFDSNIWNNHWIYWLGPAVGSLLSVLWYKILLASPENRIPRARSSY